MLFETIDPTTFRLIATVLGLVMVASGVDFRYGEFAQGRGMNIILGILLIMSPFALTQFQTPTTDALINQNQFVTTANTLYQNNIDMQRTVERLEWQVKEDNKQVESLKAENRILTKKKQSIETTPWYVSVFWVFYGMLCGVLIKGAVDKQRASKDETTPDETKTA